MGKIEQYRAHLQQMCDWESFLLAESHLPGARPNIELAQAAAEEGDAPQFRRWLALGPDAAPTDTPAEFLPYCGVLGLGRLLALGDEAVLGDIWSATEDPRQLIREAAFLALRRYDERNTLGPIEHINRTNVT